MGDGSQFKIIQHLLRYEKNQVMATFRSFIFPAIMAGLLAACSGKTNPNEEAVRYLNVVMGMKKKHLFQTEIMITSLFIEND